MRAQINLLKIRDINRDTKPCHDSEVDAAFANYLKGKSIAFVGRAEYLRNMDQGKKIDSYDIVVRLHNPEPYHFSKEIQGGSVWHPGVDHDADHFVAPKLHGKIGQRTDVFYHAVYWMRPDQFEWFSTWFDSFKKCGGKFICTEMPSATHAGLRDGGNGFVDQRVREKVIGMLHSVSYQDDIWRKHFDWCHRLDIKVYSGVMAILDIVRHDVGDVYLTGFPQMLDMPIRPINIDFRSACLHLIYLHALVEKRGFKVDSTMRALFDKYVGFGKYLGWREDETY